MIVSLITGRKGSKGFPNKHFCNILGKPLSYYPMNAVVNCKEIDTHYLSTDDKKLINLAEDMNINIIKRPFKLCTDESESKDVFIHGYEVIKEKHKEENIDIIVLIMCNAPTITSKQITEGINILKNNVDYDSAVTVSKYNMWSPVRSRKIGEDGLLHPFVSFEDFNDSSGFSSDRDSQGDVWFADMGVSVIRSRCLDDIENGVLPQKWMGNKIYPIKQELGLDVDYEWQIPQVERWIMNNIYGKK